MGMKVPQKARESWPGCPAAAALKSSSPVVIVVRPSMKNTSRTRRYKGEERPVPC